MITDYYSQIIVIQRATATANAFGGQAETWYTHLTILGYIDTLSGQEIQVADQIAAKASHVLMCDVGNDILASDRVLYDSKIYRIVALPDEVFGHHAEIMLEYVGVDQ